MQVHAVPENERYIDVSGKRMPWAYERADLAELSSSRREPAEKGAFGRSNRRRGTSRSRSKTAEPRKEEDRIRAENAAAEDLIFGKLKVEQRDKDKGAVERAEGGAVPGLPVSAAKSETKEPTEVLLYGFGDDLMWSAIEWYERVSNGLILEDYERQPPGQHEPLSRSLSRATAQKSLTRAFLRRKNTFQGGRHWIKVTFDSAEAADLAVARSPHNIRGHLVYAEPYRGAGPGKDEAIFASSAGAQITSSNMPTTFLTTEANTSPMSSATASSATVNGPARQQQEQQQQGLPRILPFVSQAWQGNQSTSTALDSSSDQPDRTLAHRTSRIQGATRAVLLPAEQALLPKQPRKSWTAWLGGREIIGSTLPRVDDGAFDWEKAGLYWRVFYWFDYFLGTDFCGLKAEE